ncbi:MAG: hypothetical protein ACYTXY_27325 [Nostoc sp.]
MSENQINTIDKCVDIIMNPVKFKDIKPGNIFVKVENEIKFNKNLVVKIDEKHGFLIEMETTGIFEDSCEVYLLKMKSTTNKLLEKLNEPFEKAITRISFATNQSRGNLIEEAIGYLVIKYKINN